jgi:hypothetical protein
MEPREFFDSLPTRVDPSKTAGMNNSYVFDIEGAGVWKVDVTDGGIEVTEGGGDADVTIPHLGGDLPRDRRGEAEPTTAYMTDELKIGATWAPP